MENSLIIPQTGMQQDKDNIQSDSQEYRKAINAVIESNGGNTFSLQNESSNLLSIKLKDGQKVIAYKYIQSIEKTILFLTNNIGGDEIAYFSSYYYDDNKGNVEGVCNSSVENTPLETVVQSSFISLHTIATGNFNWNVNYKVNIEYKLTDCNLNLYFVDGVNPDRFIYFNLPDLSLVDDFKLVNVSSIGSCNVEYYDVLDVKKTLFNQKTSYSKIVVTQEIGGTISEGVYQVFTAYSTSKGIPLSSYNGSDLISVFDKTEKQIEGKEYITNKSLNIKLENITVSSYYKYINIVIGKTVNNYTQYYSITTLPISSNMGYIYSGNTNDIIIKSEAELFTKYPYYRNSNIISSSNNYLFKAGLEEYDKINIQRIANKVQLECVTVKRKADFYKNSNDKSLIRDEVYGFGIELVMEEGEISGVGHIAGRKAEDSDMLVSVNIGDRVDNMKLNWQVNNTAKLISSPHTNEIWETFDFAYWESTDKYPNNPEIWGELCNQNIRHHKTPDCSISHIHDGMLLQTSNSFNRDVSIFPMGVRLKGKSIETILKESLAEGLITQEQKDRIVGWNLVRVDRAGNKSIVSKGLLYNVWSYEKATSYNQDDKCSTKTKYHFPSYGFNDERVDPFLSRNDEHYKYDKFDQGLQVPQLLQYENTGKYVFHSPDTHFAQPSLGNVLKLETEEYGESKGYFNVAEEQSQYKLLTYNHYNLATLLARFIANNTTHESSNASGTGQAIGSSIGGIVGSAIPGIGTAIGSVAGGIIGSLAGGDDDATSALQRNSTILFQTEKFLQLFKNLADYQKLQYQYQAVGKYTNYKPIQNNGNKQRTIVNSGYINSSKQSIGNVNINNTFRESSVYLEVNKTLPSCSVQDTSKNKLTDSISTVSTNQCKKYSVVISAPAFFVNSPAPTPTSISFQDCQGIAQRWRITRPETRTLTASIPPSESIGVKVTEIPCPECLSMVFTVRDCNCKGQELTSQISSYYASIKNNRVNQYGGIFNLQYLDVHSGVNDLNDKSKIFFGGDTFITPHAFKRKHSFFNKTTFGLPDDTDIFYQDLGNVAYPTYYFNTKENNKEIKPSTTLLFDLLQFGRFSNSTYSFWNNLFGVDDNFSKGKNILDNFAAFAFDPLLWIKAPNFYLDCRDNNVKSKPLGLFSLQAVKGIMYLYNYAIPYFYCESDVNTWYRLNKNEKELDFYPNQQDLNYWLQEKNVSIRNDNFFFYDRTYSKQNKTGFHYVNDINFKPYSDCKVTYNNRVVYSLQSSELDNSDLKDNYLINRALDYYDFSLVNGRLTGIHGIESDKVLVTFENNTQIYAAYNTLETEAGTVQIGNGGIFRSKPQEFSKNSLGYIGSQHSEILSTEFGHILIDAKRGQVFLIGTNGNGATDLVKDRMRNWFKNNLPFNITKYYDVDVDKNFADIGLAVCFDKRFNRVLITKLDYSPKYSNIEYRNNKFYYGSLEISVKDKKYFYNHSFTISYNFNTNSWTSFHSYIPNYYISQTDNFYSGISNELWGHHLTNKSYQVFYGNKYPFQIELIDKYSVENKQLQSISYMMDAVRFHNKDDQYNTIVGFNKAIIYNNNQNSGLLELELTDNKDLFKNKLYPILDTYSTKILQVNKENKFSFNQFKDRKNKTNVPSFIKSKNGVDEMLNIDVIGNNTFNYSPIMGNSNNIKLIQDKHTNYKLIFKLANFKTNNSIR